METWIERPDLYYPSPSTTGNVIKWHLAIQSMIEPEDPDIELLKRDRAYLSSLSDRDLAKVNTCMLIGRELWNAENTGFSRYLEELETYSVSISNLHDWMHIFEVCDNYEEEGYCSREFDITEIMKGSEYLQVFMDAQEEAKKEPISMNYLLNHNDIAYTITIDDASCNPLYDLIVEKDDSEEELKELSIVVSWLIRNNIRFTMTYEDSTGYEELNC